MQCRAVRGGAKTTLLSTFLYGVDERKSPVAAQAYSLREAQAVRGAGPGGAPFVAANATTWAAVNAASAIDWAAYKPPARVRGLGLGFRV